VNKRKGDKNEIEFISNTFGHGGNLFDNNKSKNNIKNGENDKKNLGDTKEVAVKIIKIGEIDHW